MEDSDFSDFKNASVAQSVERETENLRVTGSIPVRGTINYIICNDPVCEGDRAVDEIERLQKEVDRLKREVAGKNPGTAKPGTNNFV